MNFRYARIPLPTLPVHQSIDNHDKHVSRSSNCETQATFVVHYQNPRHPRKKGYQRRNTSYKTKKKNCQSPWFEKTWVTLALTRTKESQSRPYHYTIVSVSSNLRHGTQCDSPVLPIGITAGRTRILPTTELNSLPHLIKILCIADRVGAYY